MSRPAPKKIRVGIFAESRLIADSLLHILQEESDLTCSKISGFCVAWPNQPDVVLLDWQDATEANLKQISGELQNCKIIVINGDAAALDVLMCSRIGVMGFTLKSWSPGEIAKTIRSVAGGLAVIPQCIGARLYKEIHEEQNGGRRFVFRGDPLTPREQDVAHLAGDGLRNKEIAAKLSLEVATVKTHMRSVLRKLGLRDRVELVKLSEARKPRRYGEDSAA